MTTIVQLGKKLSEYPYCFVIIILVLKNKQIVLLLLKINLLPRCLKKNYLRLKRMESNRNETKRNETKQNESNRNEMKWNYVYSEGEEGSFVGLGI